MSLRVLAIAAKQHNGRHKPKVDRSKAKYSVDAIRLLRMTPEDNAPKKHGHTETNKTATPESQIISNQERKHLQRRTALPTWHACCTRVITVAQQRRRPKHKQHSIAQATGTAHHPPLTQPDVVPSLPCSDQASGPDLSRS